MRHEAAASVSPEDDAGGIVHAELRWPGGGALVLGSTAHTDSVHGDRRAGAAAVHVMKVEPAPRESSGGRTIADS